MNNSRSRGAMLELPRASELASLCARKRQSSKKGHRGVAA
jgi:hypothetical protein